MDIVDLIDLGATVALLSYTLNATAVAEKFITTSNLYARFSISLFIHNVLKCMYYTRCKSIIQNTAI